MKYIETEKAVGHIICHDITQIIPGQTKDARFRKGHVVTEEDIPVLLSLGKEHLYVWEPSPGMVHENDAALRLQAICQNQYMKASPVKEGKIELTAERPGLFLVDTKRLLQINMNDQLMIATRHGDTAVHTGDKLAGMRIIPLMIDESRLVEAEQIGGGRPLLQLLPWKLKTAGMIITGSEIYKGRITDKFGPVVEEKLKSYGIQVVDKTLADDKKEMICEKIQQMRRQNVDLIVCTGGMSVDPDDCTPGAIRESGAAVVSYGSPVLPGAMLLVGYFADGVPILGLPGCVMYAKATVFDLVLPRIVAGYEVDKAFLAAKGHGGLCLGCPECHYPDCAFGK